MPVPVQTYPAPLEASSSLQKYTATDLTPTVGTELASLQLAHLLSDESAIRDLAILVSQRGVVFLRDQQISPSEQNELVAKMGQQTGRPKESSNHIHPLSDGNELGEVFKITPEFNGAADKRSNLKSTRAANLWHSDITFETYPSDYAILKLNTIPPTGGDTLWASAYEAFDRLSPAYQAFLSGLTAVHVGDQFVERKQKEGLTFHEPRGHPENKGQELEAIHPVIRTHPVTGWKGLFVNKCFTKRIVELSVDESDHVLSYLFDHIVLNHDLQVRWKWTKDAVAIWDNRCTLHCATNDYGALERIGDRVVSVGERPYYDPSSTSRSESLQNQNQS